MLDHDALRGYCLGQVSAVEEFPFEPDLRVFKVMGKMFALMPVSATPPRIILKCDPFFAEVLRQTYPAVRATFHKRYWNAVTVDGSIPDDEVRDMIDASYDLVVKGLRRRDREALARFGRNTRE